MTIITGIKFDDELIVGKTGSVGPGAYEATWDVRAQRLSLTPEESRNDKLVFGANDPSTVLTKDFARWLEAKAEYDLYGFAYRRGVLLHGIPGCGKTAAVMQLKRDMVAAGGLVLSGFPFIFCSDVMDQIREQTDIPVMLVFDDCFDGEGDNRSEDFLRFLDGEKDYGQVIVLCTTNFYHNLDPAYKRPSRFDTRIEVKGPSDETVQAFLDAKHSSDLFQELAANRRHNVWKSMANIKEYLLLRKIFHKSVDEALSTLEEVLGLTPGEPPNVKKMEAMAKAQGLDPWAEDAS